MASCLFTFYRIYIAIVATGPVATYTNYIATILSNMCIDYISLTWLKLYSICKGVTESDYHTAQKGVWLCKCRITHCTKHLPMFKTVIKTVIIILSFNS